MLFAVTVFACSKKLPLASSSVSSHATLLYWLSGVCPHHDLWCGSGQQDSQWTGTEHSIWDCQIPVWSNSTEVICSGSEQDHDSRDEKTWQVRTEEAWGSSGATESGASAGISNQIKLNHFLPSKLRIYSDLTRGYWKSSTETVLVWVLFLYVEFEWCLKTIKLVLFQLKRKKLDLGKCFFFFSLWVYFICLSTCLPTETKDTTRLSPLVVQW